MIRKFDIFKPMDVVRPLCVSDDNGEFRFQLRLTRNSDLIFASEDLSTKGLWTEVPFLTIFVERQSPEILEHSQNEPDRLSEPKNVGGDAAAKLVELSTRLEKVEILLGSAMLRSTTKGSSNASSPFPKEVVPASDNLKQTPVESRVSMTPQAASNFVTTATSPHSPPPTCTPRKVASSVSSKLKATSDKTPVSKSVQAAAVSSHCPPGGLYRRAALAVGRSMCGKRPLPIWPTWTKLLSQWWLDWMTPTTLRSSRPQGRQPSTLPSVPPP
ncbi:hypothetical protein EGR_03951 [Echinococcus granulosus]|uniref:Uncharacterized protein n=1 Tax=Echinococcus granulosus TaxID=6210 RepID=W6UJF9_ECHGR|nr:hypothetical protein EGR_03951 [Echinococcus granulosus]EUB61276.1 hypothetical protein EGR_03951 [Echinococcus granulosus]